MQIRDKRHMFSFFPNTRYPSPGVSQMCAFVSDGSRLGKMVIWEKWRVSLDRVVFAKRGTRVRFWGKRRYVFSKMCAGWVIRSPYLSQHYLEISQYAIEKICIVRSIRHAGLAATDIGQPICYRSKQWQWTDAACHHCRGYIHHIPL